MMKELMLNKDKLKNEDINEEVTRVKALMIDSNNKIILAYGNDCYQFPGGHLEKNEKAEDGLIREVKEETGIDISKYELKPFLMIKHLSKNYFNSGKNRCNKIIYYIIKTDEKIDFSKTSFTDYEIKHNFKIGYYNMNEIEELLIDHSNKNISSKPIAYEMLQVLYEYETNYKG